MVCGSDKIMYVTNLQNGFKIRIERLLKISFFHEIAPKHIFTKIVILKV